MRKSPKRKSPKRKSPKRKSPKRKSKMSMPRRYRATEIEMVKANLKKVPENRDSFKDHTELSKDGKDRKKIIDRAEYLRRLMVRVEEANDYLAEKGPIEYDEDGWPTNAYPYNEIPEGQREVVKRAAIKRDLSINYGPEVHALFGILRDYEVTELYQLTK